MNAFGQSWRLAILLSALEQVLGCSTGWLAHGKDCFKVFEVETTYMEATRACAGIDAKVPSMARTEDVIFLFALSEKYANKTFWIQSKIQNPEDGICIFFQRSSLFTASCNGMRSIICEQNSAIATVLGIFCPQDMDHYSSSCFWQDETLRNRDQAAAICAVKGGHLADLDDKLKEYYGTTIGYINSGNFWVGASKQGDVFIWSNGKPLDPIAAKDLVAGEGLCVQLHAKSMTEEETQLLWRENCTNLAKAFCQSPARASTFPTGPYSEVTLPNQPPIGNEPSCPTEHSWKVHAESGVCFWETTYQTDHLSWEDARRYCKAYGGDLASYQDAGQELEALGDEKGNSELWIGLRRQPGENEFKWSDGSAVNYTNWSPDQPNLRSSNKLCVAHMGSESTWEASYCGIRRWFICRAPKVLNPVSPEEPILETKTKCEVKNSPSSRDWYLFDGHCYLAYGSRTYSWEMGRMFCEDNGAYLASVHSFPETDFLLSLVDESADFWIGLRSRGIHSSFAWSDGSPLQFVNWDEDEENETKAMDIETCVFFDRKSGVWHRSHCNRLSAVFCKRGLDSRNVFTKQPPTPTLPGFCPSDWYTLGNNCYKSFGRKFLERQTWRDANIKCLNMGAKLASIHNQEEQDLLSDLVMDTGQATWIGLSASVRGSIFHWSDDSTIDFTSWNEGEPMHYDRQEDCVEMVYEEDSMGKWNDNECRSLKPYICQQPKDPTLSTSGKDPSVCLEPSGWSKLGSSCYNIIQESENHQTWSQAQLLCRQDGGNLATVKNYAVTIFFKRHILKEEKEVFWIGMRETKPNTYAWLSRRPLQYSQWLSGQPQRLSEFHNCVAINFEGLWMVRNCKEKHPFICEVDSEPIPTSSPSGQEVCPNSTVEWRDFGLSSCYLIEMDTQLSWIDAMHTCFRKGGALASFHSKEQLDVIAAHIMSSDMPLHIGFGQNHDGSYDWVDGSPVDFTNWGPEEPNSKEELCVEILTDSFTWNDINCNEMRGYICATPKVPVSLDQMTALGRNDTHEDAEKIRQSVKIGGIVGITVCVLLLLLVAAVAAYYLCPATRMRPQRLSIPVTP